MRILHLVRRDLRLAARSQLATYMVLAIAALCVMVRLWLPTAAEQRLGFAASATLPASLHAALAAHGELILLPDGAAVEARVRGLDDVAGVREAPGGGVEVVLEGQEPAALAELTPWILARWAAAAAGDPGVRVEAEPVAGPPPRLFAGAAALLILGAALGGGVIVGFGVVEEREQGTIQALRAGPLGGGGYLGAKALLAGGLTLGAGLLNALLVAGPVLPWGPVALALLGLVPVAWALAAALGGAADNQLAGVTALKGLSLVVSGVPLASFALAGPWAWVLAPFPNHWAFQAVLHALQGQPGWAGELGLALLLGGVWAAGAGVWMLRRVGWG